MKVDLLNTFAWDETNELAQSRLSAHVPNGGTLRVYGGLSQALFEVAFGTALLFSHKKNMAVLSGNTWAFEGVLPHLYKEGFQVQEEKIAKITDWKAYLANLKKENSFVLWCEDDPVFGTYQDCDELDQELNKLRIFSIRVSHSAHLFKPVEIRPYTIRICSINPMLTLAKCGQKFRAAPLMVHRSVWNPAATVATIEQALTRGSEDRSAIQAFESAVERKTGFKSVLKTDARLFDRAVVYHPELNSDSVLRRIKEKSGHGLNTPMYEIDAEILNQCRWSPSPHLRAWWDPLPSEEIIRGLLLLSTELVKEGQSGAAGASLLDWLADGEASARLTIG